MSFITELMTVLGAIESDKLTVHEERCISIRNRNANCIRCAEVCTTGAISYCNNEVKVDPSACIGCGTCATACPSSAIEINTPSDDELTKSLKAAIVASNGHPVIACEIALEGLDDNHYDADQIALLPCLGRIDESSLIALGAYKARSTTLLCGDCETCEHSPGGRMIREVITSATNILDAFACTLPIELTSEIPKRILDSSSSYSSANGMSRRDLFNSAKQSTTRVGKKVATQKVNEILGEEESRPVAFQKVNEEGTLSHFIPTRRVRIYNYLKHIGEPVAKTVETRVIGSLEIETEKCSACRMCAVFCPTGAITKVDDDLGYGIKHRPSACMQCRLCEEICPENAITIGSEVSIEQFMGKKAVFYEMKKPTWQPNKPTSLYDKIHTVLGDDLEMCSF